MENISKISFTFLIIFTISSLFLSCKSKSEDTTSNTSGTPVKTANPTKMDLTQYITLNANTIFMKKEIVRTTFQGSIKSIYKNIGDKINVGDLLMELTTKEFIGDDSLGLQIASEKFKGLIQIKAKSNGILTELDYNKGDYVTDGEQIAVISNPASLRIQLNVPYQYSNKLRQGKACIVNLPDESRGTGIVEKILPIADPVTQTQTFIVKLNETLNIPEGLNVNVQIPINSVRNALVVPLSALISNETMNQFWVMKIINDTTAVRVDIKTGIENQNDVEILDRKLNLNDIIIIDGAYGLPDTAKVAIEK